MNKQTFTLTFGDVAENHKGMEKIGEEVESGLDLEDLARAGRWFEEKGADYEIVYLNELLEGEDVDYDEDVTGAYLLIVRGGLNILLNDDEGANKMYEEQDALEKDDKAFMYGRVVGKKARHNLCFSDWRRGAAYDKGMGTVVAFSDVPHLKQVREKWMEVLDNEKVNKLQCEGNYYYDVKKTFIGFHGDSERKIVIAVRLGADFPLFYQWYHHGAEVGQRYKVILSHGDLYMMSDKAVGWDWKKKNIYTLRHAAGFESSLKLKAVVEDAGNIKKILPDNYYTSYFIRHVATLNQLKDLLKAHNIKGFTGFDKINLATLTYYKFLELGLVEKEDDRLTEVKTCFSCNENKECPNAKSFCVDCLGIDKLVIKK